MNNLATGSPKEHFCKIIWKSVQWFLTRRFLKFSIKIYKENKPPPSWWPCFLTNPNGLNNLATGSPKEHFCKIIWKSVQWFLTRRFLKFSIQIYSENKPPPPGGHVFWQIQMAWTILVQDLQRNISAKLYGNRSSGFAQDFSSFLYRYIGKISPAPWWPCFLTNPNGLNNLGRGSPKEHFCKIILKSVQWFLTRRFLKVFYIDYIGKISPTPWRPCFFTNPNVLNNLGIG